jgi:hypothetical protein
MDRYPQDGIEHLRDGTLAGWLEEEGALHLAALAREVVRLPKADMRASLETFLQGTGLVAPPQLVLKPFHLNFGFILQGQKMSRQLMLEKGQGRGHLFGEVTGRNPWLRVEPRAFDGAPAKLVVTVETGGLNISPTLYLSDVVVKSSASAEPSSVPVMLRVVAQPSRSVQFVLRPLMGFVLGAILGAGVGLVWWATGLSNANLAGLWILALALIWGLAGLLVGLRQPPAWPARYALGRWTLKAAAWGVALAVLFAAIVEAWRLGLGGGLSLPGLTLPAAAAVGVAFGFGPATLDELAQGRHARDQGYVHGRPSDRRRALLWGGAVVLLLVSLMAPRVITATVRRAEIQAALQPARAWLLGTLENLGDGLDKFVDELELRYYSKPAGETSGSKEPLIQLPKALGGN